jgi:hypothetical protein
VTTYASSKDALSRIISPFVLLQHLKEFIIAAFACGGVECHANMCKVFAKPLALACLVKVCQEVPHAPTVLELWKA